MGVVAARGDLDVVLGEHPADRLDPELVPVLVDVRADHLSRRSSSAAAKNADCRLQNLVGAAQFSDLTAQPDQFRMLVGGRARPGAGVDLGPLDPAAQRLGMHVDQRADLPAGLDRRLTRMRLSTLLVHPHRPVAGLLVVLAGCRHGSILLGRSEPPPEPGHLSRPGLPRGARSVGVRPATWRSRCRLAPAATSQGAWGCLVTHVLLPVTVLLRRADAAGVIWAGSLARGVGPGGSHVAGRDPEVE